MIAGAQVLMGLAVAGVAVLAALPKFLLASLLATVCGVWLGWLPSSGWRAYRSARGDPSSDHTNHVHLSVY